MIGPQAPALPEPKNILLRFWDTIMKSAAKSLVTQDYESVQSILSSFGIVAALLLSILIGLVMSVPIEESVRGDILSLSLSSPHFRCHFASPTTNTIEICSPSFTIALFGTTNASTICKDVGPAMTKRSNGYHAFYCATDIPRAIRGNGASWNARSSATTSSSANETRDGCSSSSFKEAYQVANTISDEAYLEYLMQEMPASDVNAESWFGWPGKFSTCQPSARLTSLGFKALLFLMLALFWDLYLLVSLTFTSASTNSTDMKVWWLSGGAVGSLLIFGMLLSGTIFFLYSMEYLVMIRFPSPYDHLKYKTDFMDSFIIFGIWASLVFIGVHYVVGQLYANWSSVMRLWSKILCKKHDVTELGNNYTKACDQIKEIQDKPSRKCLQTANLDERKLMAFLNDTLLLNAVLLEAGIESPGERLEILLTLKTIEREKREGSNSSRVPIIIQGTVGHCAGVPGVPVT